MTSTSCGPPSSTSAARAERSPPSSAEMTPTPITTMGHSGEESSEAASRLDSLSVVEDQYNVEHSPPPVTRRPRPRVSDSAIRLSPANNTKSGPRRSLPTAGNRYELRACALKNSLPQSPEAEPFAPEPASPPRPPNLLPPLPRITIDGDPESNPPSRRPSRGVPITATPPSSPRGSFESVASLPPIVLSQDEDREQLEERLDHPEDIAPVTGGGSDVARWRQGVPQSRFDGVHVDLETLFTKVQAQEMMIQELQRCVFVQGHGRAPIRGQVMPAPVQLQGNEQPMFAPPLAGPAYLPPYSYSGWNVYCPRCQTGFDPRPPFVPVPMHG
ncbi:hypothetical protein OF83DRAFT_1179357 [Amylostereum chailletii]|nr:hypothetical protein OF83DRAFT_1179357 [Amylostereum chailletii]